MGQILHVLVSTCRSETESPLLQKMEEVDKLIMPESEPIKLDLEATLAFLEAFWSAVWQTSLFRWMIIRFEV
jgi:hypothetical protein